MRRWVRFKQICCTRIYSLGDCTIFFGGGSYLFFSPSISFWRGSLTCAYFLRSIIYPFLIRM
ncbi:hypothetical protein BDQ94DRAFT_96920 [Aspergillus welwitschiae]|uniref:Uncharacterized protein n=1 Tax=Aspergillus welwitschiae TaxID=1341132 RepID=A0A3F3PN89_9EURO|nr:hypothetical protein BDQ94DRAFT_96920 [Aspergillus welwitschiae]RDH28411.1 hypothetical protein BDQ94DRAFT_96920 [Aspergillus welwitschiae]